MDEIASGWQEVGHLEGGAPVFMAPVGTPPPVTYHRWLLGDPLPADLMPAPRIEILDFDAELDAELERLTRLLLCIPDGFPLWYVAPQLALTVGPIGRLVQQTQCLCGHDSLQHIVILGECLGGACDCRLLRLRPRAETGPRWREWLRRYVRALTK